jgi:hypothetical protein
MDISVSLVSVVGVSVYISVDAPVSECDKRPDKTVPSQVPGGARRSQTVPRSEMHRRLCLYVSAPSSHAVRMRWLFCSLLSVAQVDARNLHAYCIVLSFRGSGAMLQ